MRPEEITARSFALIAEALRGRAFDPQEWQVVQRVIHAAADFDYAEMLRFHPRAVEAGVTALRVGCDVVADVRMVEVGIDAGALRGLGGQVRCWIRDDDVGTNAREHETTRAAAAMQKAVSEAPDAVFAIGSAPTALEELLRFVRAGAARPALIIGVPVGFVGAAEAKEELTRVESVPWIATQGCKGGSAVAAAVVNALLTMAAESTGCDATGVGTRE